MFSSKDFFCLEKKDNAWQTITINRMEELQLNVNHYSNNNSINRIVITPHIHSCIFKCILIHSTYFSPQILNGKMVINTTKTLKNSVLKVIKHLNIIFKKNLLFSKKKKKMMTLTMWVEWEINFWIIVSHSFKTGKKIGCCIGINIFLIYF